MKPIDAAIIALLDQIIADLKSEKTELVAHYFYNDSEHLEDDKIVKFRYRITPKEAEQET